MVTMVGNDSEFSELVNDLVYLDHDTIAAYGSPIERFDNNALSAKRPGVAERLCPEPHNAERDHYRGRHLRFGEGEHEVDAQYRRR